MAHFSPRDRSTCWREFSRQTVIELAESEGINVIERDLDLYDALAADEVFLTSTSLCVCGVRSVQGQKIGDGAAHGPITKRLMERLRQAGRLRLGRAVFEAAGQVGPGRNFFIPNSWRAFAPSSLSAPPADRAQSLPLRRSSPAYTRRPEWLRAANSTVGVSARFRAEMA